MKTKFVPLPKEVVAYLKEETMVLPKECIKYVPEHQDWVLDTVEEDTLLEPEFPDFSEKIESLLRQTFSRSAFVKLNWHSPQDAAWITMRHNLEIQDLQEFYLILKASSLTKSDLSKNLLPNSNYTVALREYVHINNNMEFRCFVYNNKLIAICAREWKQSNSFIKEHVTQIMSDIMNFFRDQIKFKFYLSHFVFDVIHVAKRQVRLVDFCPFYPKFTSVLAYSWTQLDALATNVNNQDHDEPEFKFLSSETGIQPNPKHNYGFPIDILEFYKHFELEASSDIPVEQHDEEVVPVHDRMKNKLLKIEIKDEFLKRFGITDDYYRISSTPTSL